ncbi:MAG TPA: SRPBCC family protein [Solirubrobacterales bacterium]|nr:SRPBCC family protein [Solirubrobacterales bacterium]
MTQDPALQARLGTIEEVGDKRVLRYERRLDHPVERVWAALTEPDQLALWLAAVDELELVEGGRIALRWLNVPDSPRNWEEHGVELGDADPAEPVTGMITELDPPRVIEYDADKMGRMRWELRPEGDGCVLAFTNTIEPPEGFSAMQTLAGWHIHLDHLVDALAGSPVEWSTWTEDHMGDWERIRDRYEAHDG